MLIAGCESRAGAAITVGAASSQDDSEEAMTKVILFYNGASPHTCNKYVITLRRVDIQD